VSADEAAAVVRVDPPDRACGVFRDVVVTVTFSDPVEVGEHPEPLQLRRGDQPVPGHVGLSPDRRCLWWRPRAPLPPGVPHVVETAWLRDSRGREVAPHRSWFVCGRRSATGDP